jgi:hypothetical protein
MKYMSGKITHRWLSWYRMVDRFGATFSAAELHGELSCDDG